ncbi:glycosyltransferase family protein [Desulfovibrio cuneatus]|uniref:glycosyltransferase family protein n=1 Tax=Desulfovibrio cuneatus TaxID=159728 RepID=UPI000413693F|nr:glycosyltransferase [Desulfovibrio cuneatus]
MRICLLDAPAALTDALQSAGHKVAPLASPGGVLHLPKFLAANKVEPELFIQVEHLGRRTLLQGLEGLACPTLFWAIDTHLNHYWQQYYALLFDGLLTPHISLFAKAPHPLAPQKILRFATPAQAMPWQPHANRRNPLALWARLTQERPARAWLVALLQQQCGLVHSQEGTLQDMMALYANTRMVPNETIAGEVNFRLLEVAAAGCLVLSPQVGEDQNALLCPGKEYLPYTSALELLEHIHWGMQHPNQAEAMGHKAWLRVQAEHLPAHRAHSLLQYGAGLTQNRATGPEAKLLLWLALAWHVRNGRVNLPATDTARQGAALAAGVWQRSPLAATLAGNAMAMSICLLAEDTPAACNDAPKGSSPVAEHPGTAAKHQQVQQSNTTQEALALAAMITAQAQERSLQWGGNAATDAPQHPGSSLPVLSVAMCLALRENQVDAITRYQLCLGAKRGAGAPQREEMCIHLASLLRAHGHLAHAGFSFQPEKDMLATTALEWLLLARQHAPHSVAVQRHLTSFVNMCPGYHILLLDKAHSQPGQLAHAAQAEQQIPPLHPTWRHLLEQSVTCLQLFLVGQGICLAQQALASARAVGKEDDFLRTLVRHDPGGLMAQLLGTGGKALRPRQ